MRTRLLLLAAVLALALLPARRVAAAGRLDERIFANRPSGEPASFLVVFRDEADLSGASRIADRVERLRFVSEALRAQAEVSQASLRDRLIAAGVPFRSYFIVNMIEVEAPRALAEEIASRDEVSTVSANPRVRIAREPATSEPAASPLSARTPHSSLSIEPNLAKIGAPVVWARGFTGQGMVVGIADTGFVWDHPALKPHYRGFDGVTAVHDHHWHDAVHDPAPGNACGATAPAPCDDDGHGTSTAGVSVGDDGAGNQIGVAPGARFVGCRNMDRGVGTPARYAECFEWFLAPTDRNGANPRPDLAPHVINNSWGCPAREGCTDPNVLTAVVDHVVAAGIFVAVSAGNSGPACSTISDAPTFYASSFTVAATTLDDEIAGFSSRGPAAADGSGRLKPEIAAPGVGIRTAVSASDYRTFSGTSAAAPHVAGAVALLWSSAPAFVGDVAGTASLLERTAAPLTSTQDCGVFPGAGVPNTVFGWGRLDVAAAVAVASTPIEPRARPIPGPRRRPGGRVVSRS